MKLFNHAIAKTPGQSMIDGISHAQMGLPDYALALEQHHNYITALESCGVKVAVLTADEQYPDSCFVEDAAVLTPHCAIITNPGADSRNGETAAIEMAVKNFYQNLEYITTPGTLDGGDVMMVGEHYYIGLSKRTNRLGAQQFIHILNAYGMTGSTVDLTAVLHLKTGLSYLENNRLMVSGEFVDKPVFDGFEKIQVPADECYAANCIWVNDQVIMPQGFPQTQAKLEQQGIQLIIVNVSEFEKLDGGLSCLSLRF